MLRLLDNSVDIKIPDGISATKSLNSNDVMIFNLKYNVPIHINRSVSVVLTDKSISLSVTSKKLRSYLNTSCKLIHSVFNDLLNGYSTKLSFVGVGYKCSYVNATNTLILSLGYSHKIAISKPNNIDLSCDQSGSTLIVSGCRRYVGDFISFLSNLRAYDPYKGKGLIIDGALYIRKEGKKV